MMTTNWYTINVKNFLRANNGGLWLTRPGKKLHFHVILLEEVAGNNQTLDFTGSFVNFRDTGIAVIAFNWHVRNVAHSTQHLDSL